MKTRLIIDHIIEWLSKYAENSRTNGFVVGISGGIDSAVTSTLCALTGKKVVLVEMPIYQPINQVGRGREHITWLMANSANVSQVEVDLTPVFEQFTKAIPKTSHRDLEELALANTRARLRMTTLYYLAGIHHLLVAGTGNKVEDFGIGFYTKYGDGGVDISPIADLNKSMVYELGQELGIAQSILSAPPTDGLWGDDRNDADQIGASYPELEWAMTYIENHQKINGDWNPGSLRKELTARQTQVLKIFWTLNRTNQHKMQPIPICQIPAAFLM